MRGNLVCGLVVDGLPPVARRLSRWQVAERPVLAHDQADGADLLRAGPLSEPGVQVGEAEVELLGQLDHLPHARLHLLALGQAAQELQVAPDPAPARRDLFPFHVGSGAAGHHGSRGTGVHGHLAPVAPTAAAAAAAARVAALLFILRRRGFEGFLRRLLPRGVLGGLGPAP
ncbi:uncharacterized protein PG986_013334 [Apiospora aurea]|uniref:Uncharacterized protein n=1 Tax=Apiospora aurea TaxID=335848 RepID=A0ABR1PV95_9PEZI